MDLVIMMPLDTDLIRTLLLRFEQNDTSVPEGKTREVVAYHVKQMKLLGLVDAAIRESTRRGRKVVDDFHVLDITPAGHDLIRAIKTEGFWARLVSHAKAQAVPLTLELVLRSARRLGSQAFGLGEPPSTL
jgi:hypothetical protein